MKIKVNIHLISLTYFVMGIIISILGIIRNNPLLGMFGLISISFAFSEFDYRKIIDFEKEVKINGRKQ